MHTQWLRQYIRKATATLDEARFCLNGQRHRAAIARAYYALYQAANAWMDYQEYDRTDRTRKNWHHNEVNKNWPNILADLGIDEFDADTIYTAAQDFRVRVEYTGPEPSPRDAKECVQACERAVGWLLKALEKGGHHGDRETS